MKMGGADMHETYCGKSCADCSHREELACPGCRMGPGRANSGDCSISRCSVSKGYHACEFCGSRDSCRNRRSRETAPEERARKQRAEAAKTAQIKKNAQLLGRWLWLLFWLVIISNIVSLVFNNNITADYPTLQLVISIVDIVVAGIYSLILLRILSVSDHYRYAGIFGGVCICLSILSLLTSGGLNLLFSILVLICGFFKEYHEFLGHSDALSEVDDNLSEKWCLLWYWFFGSLCAVLIGAVFTFIGLPLGTLAVLVGAVLTLVASVIKIYYLLRTATLFKVYAEELSEKY